MVLRDLADRTVSLRQDGGNLRQYRVGNVDPVIVGWHGDCEQPRLGEGVEFVEGQDPVGVALV
ncbi:hypothetical protein D3C87_2119010 [compost metagenome]